MEQQRELGFEEPKVTLSDGSVWNESDCAISESDGKWHLKDALTEFNGKWYDPDDVIVDYDGDERLRDDCEICESDGEWHLRADLTEFNGCWYDPDDLVEDYQGNTQLREDCREEDLDGYGYSWILSEDLDEYWSYCDHCSRYVSNDDYNFDRDMCWSCWNESHRDGPILDYHDHSRVPDKFYGHEREGFVGGGFELEITGNPNSDGDPQGEFNQEFAEDLAPSAGLEEGEIYYETDCSIGDGFEIISAPHTVKDFWDKQAKWAAMLDICSSEGYKSHDARCCGLHVHVSRGMFGQGEQQKTNIAKVCKFYEVRWDDFVRASRRKNFTYCNRPNYDYEGGEPKEFDRDSKAAEYKKKVFDEELVRGHGCALNNANPATFEYRLGRGTLNKVSFFAWIDLCFTISKNSKKSETSLFKDNSEWLKGIREQTASYLYKRGAFKEEVLKLFPQLEWESDQADQEVA